MSVAIVFAGGEQVAPAIAAVLPSGALVIAADSGLHAARALGLRVDRLVGDLDSADPAAVELAAAAGTAVDRHPAEKDATDLELALDAAVASGVRHIVVVDGGGDRLDHLLGNLLLLGSAGLAGVRVEAYVGAARVQVARGGEEAVALEGTPGDLVTLLALGGEATGVTTAGLRYPLASEALGPGTTRGVSNELSGSTASVALDHGILLVVQPFGGAS